MVKFALFTLRSVRVSVDVTFGFQRERGRSTTLVRIFLRYVIMNEKRENEELRCENERNVPHLLQVNNIFVARRLELIGIPPTFSSPTLFSSVVLVEDDNDSASIRSLLGCSDANEESSRVSSFVVLLLVVVLLLLENGDSETTFQEDGCSSETILQTTNLSSFSLRKNDSDDEKKKKKKKKSLSFLIFGGGGGRGGARKRESSGTNGTSCLILSLFRRRKVRETKRREDAIS